MDRISSPQLHRPDDASRAPQLADELRIAAIDIGSNSIRQIIADVSPNGTIRVVDEMKASPRLGEGITQTSRLSSSAMRNALDALVRMATLSRQMGVHRVEAVATSAVRDAENGAEFLDLVRETTGLRVRVLNGDEEAMLSYRSALAHFDLGAGRTVIMDIGGGSLELVLSAGALVDGVISLPYGAVRLTEQFLGPSPSRRDLTALRRYVRKGLREHLSRRHWQGAQLIGSGGTFTNLAQIVLARQGLDPRRHVHGTIISRADVEHALDALQEMSLSERQMVPGLSPTRADIIVAGVAVIAEVLARLEARQLAVSAYGIREGLLLEAAHVPPVVADPGVARERSVTQLAERSHYEVPHAHHVQQLALQLFDALAHTLALTPDDRCILADAALLHDIGYHINFEDHHKHSYHLILHAELLGMTPADRVMVAHVARYHRGAEPKSTHRNYATLDKPMRRRIKRLAAILRIADGLDRGHAGAVDHVDVEWTDDALRLVAAPAPNASDLRLELWGASRKAGLLSRLLKMPVEFVGPDGVFTQE